MTTKDFNDAAEISKIIADSVEKIIEEHIKDFRKKSVLKMEKVMIQSFDEDLLKIWRDIGIPFGEIVTNDYKDISPYLIEDTTYEYLSHLFAELVYTAVVERGTQFIEPDFD